MYFKSLLWFEFSTLINSLCIYLVLFQIRLHLFSQPVRRKLIKLIDWIALCFSMLGTSIIMTPWYIENNNNWKPLLRSVWSIHCSKVSVFLHKPQTELHMQESIAPELVPDPCTKPLALFRKVDNYVKFCVINRWSLTPYNCLQNHPLHTNLVKTNENRFVS